MNEMQPRAVALRPQFIAGATERLHKGDKPLKAMRDEVSTAGQKYLCLGNLVPDQIITGSNGVSRVVDLPSIFNYGYVNRSFVAANRVNSADDLIERTREHKFEPSCDMNNEAVLIRADHPIHRVARIEIPAAAARAGTSRCADRRNNRAR